MFVLLRAGAGRPDGASHSFVRATGRGALLQLDSSKMKSSRAARKRFTVLGSIVLASLLPGPVWYSPPIMAQTQPTSAPTQATPTPTPHNSSASPAAKQQSPSEAASRKAWREWMSRNPPPKKGCFKATYPYTKWQRVPCAKTSPYPNPHPPAQHK